MKNITVRNRRRKIWALLIVLLMVFQLFPHSGLSSLRADDGDSFNTLELKVYNGSTSGGAETSSARTGETYRVVAKYGLGPNSTGEQYRGAAITIDVPRGVDLDFNGDGQIDDNDYERNADIIYVEASKRNDDSSIESLTFVFSDTVTTGTVGEVALKVRFPNMTTANGVSAVFGASMRGQYGVTGTENTFNVSASDKTVTAVADDSWGLTKTAVTNTPTPVGGQYEVNYTLTAFTGASASVGGDRSGRLALEDFQIVDVLPTNYKENGGAKSVKITGGANMGTLQEGTDYTLERDSNGYISKIFLNKYAKNSDTGANYIPTGAALNTEYQIAVFYDKAPYDIPSNLNDDPTKLTNNATLTYQLYSQSERTVTASYDVYLGVKEDDTGDKSLTINKELKVGDRTFALNQAALNNGYQRATFQLYFDAACTTVANDINGNPLQPVSTDSTGKASYPDATHGQSLRYGTYYLVEEPMEGFAATYTQANPLKIEIDQQGKISYGGLQNQETVKITNVASGYGIAEFTKKGKGSADNTVRNLSGVEFKLVKTDNASISKEATSGSDGKVTFHALPDGTYNLYETGLPQALIDDGYSFTASTPILTNIQVTGGQVNMITDGSEAGTVMNESTGGRYTIHKVDEDNQYTRLSARFAVYGPYPTGTASLPGNAGVKEYIDVPAAGYTSTYQPTGVYFFKEVTAPNGYVLSDTVTSLTVTQHNTESKTITNTQQGILAIHKYGKMEGKRESGGLSGVEFNVYKEDKTTLVGKITTVATMSGPYHDVSVGDGSKGALMVDPGKYWIEEISAPEGYQQLTGMIEVNVMKGNTNDKATEVEVENTTTKGRIKISKYGADDGLSKSGAVFEVYKGSDQTSATLIETITTGVDGTATTSLLDSDAKYFLKETKAPTGYVIPQNPWINGYSTSGGTNTGIGNGSGSGISIQADKVIDIRVDNQHQVELHIIKQESIGGEKLTGATFELFLNGTSVGTQTITNRDQGAVFTGLYPGTVYTYKEIQAPTGYLMTSESEGSVTTASGTTGNYSSEKSVKNDKLAIPAVDKVIVFQDEATSLNTEAAAARFSLYPFSGNPSSLSTAPNSNGTWDNPSSALLNEITGKATADLAAADAGDVLENITLSGHASIPNYYSLNIKAALTASSKTGLAPGYYWVVETAAVTDYDIAVPALIEIKSGENNGVGTATHGTISNYTSKGKIRFTKVDINTGSGLSGAEFEVFDSGDNSLGKITTDNSGVGVSGFLAPGIYKLVETKAPNTYALDESPKYVKVEAGKFTAALVDSGGIPITGENEEKGFVVNNGLGELEITKYSAYSSHENNEQGEFRFPLSGVEFKIYKSSTDDDTNTTALSSDLVVANQFGDTYTTENGQITFGKIIPAGYYWIEETKTVAGHEALETTPAAKLAKGQIKLVEITHNGMARVSFDNKPVDAKLRIIKVDEKGNPIAAEAQFELYYEVTASTIGAIEIKVDDNGTEVTKYVLPVENSDSSTYTLTTSKELDENNNIIPGQALSKELDENLTYFIKETQSPGRYGIINLWTGPVSLTLGEITEVVIENSDPIPGTIWKYRNNTEEKLTGVKYALFEGVTGDPAALTKANALNEYLKTATGFGATDAEIEALKATYGFDQWSTTDSNGQLNFVDLRVGNSYTYYLVELASVDDYDRADEVVAFRVINDASGNPQYYAVDENGNITGGLYLRNYSKSSIYVKKIAQWNGQDILLDGAEFQLYRATLPDGETIHNGNHVCDSSCKYEKVGSAINTYTTGTAETGVFITEKLRYGDYILVETKAPEGFEIDPAADTWHIKLEPGVDNKYLFDNPVVNESQTLDKMVFNKVDFHDTDITLAAKFTVYQEETPGLGDYAPYKHPIYKKDNSGNIYLDRNTVLELSSGDDGIVETPFLPHGNYKLVETSVTPKNGKTYSLADFTFTIGTGGLTEDIITNKRQGSVTINKTSQYNGGTATPMQGVTFRLYKDQEGNIPASSWNATTLTGTTNAAGTVTIGSVDAGPYWVHETNIGNNPGFAANAPAQQVVVAADGNVEVNFVNTATQGKIEVTKKQTYTGLGLSGAEFEIWTAKLDNGSYVPDSLLTSAPKIVTGTGGVGTSSFIAPGEYFIKETKAPGDHLIDEDPYFGKISVPENGLGQITVENDRIHEIKLTKYSVYGSTKLQLPGAGFSIYTTRTDAENDNNRMDTKTTDSNGALTFTGLRPDTTYYIVETGVPAAHVNSGQIHEVATRTTDVATVETLEVSNTKQGQVQIHKYGKWYDINGALTGEVSLSGAVFEIFKDAGGGTLGATTGETMTTDGSGDALSAYLDPGDYVLKEITPPSGYQLSTDLYPVTVEAGQTNTAFTGTNGIENQTDRGNFTVYKHIAGMTPQDPANGLRATFKLYVKENGQYVPYNGDSSNFVVDKAYTSGLLPPGEYKIEEVDAPSGYSLNPETKEFTIEANTTKIVEFANYRQGNVRVNKTADEQNGYAPLSGAEFQIYKDSAYTQPVFSQSKTTDGSGQIVWNGLDAGTYYVKELAAPSGYAIDSSQTIKPVTVAKTGAEQTVDVETNNGTPLTTKVINASTQGRILIQKLNNDATPQPLSGAVFEIRSNPNDPVPIETVTTGSDGYATSSLLSAAAGGTVYYVKEVEAPNGYTLDDTIYDLEKTVNVKPVQEPAKGGGENEVIFYNMPITFVDDYISPIKKEIVSLTGSKGLMLQDYALTYRIYRDNPPENVMPLYNMTITDEDIELQYRVDGQTYAIDKGADDYQIDAVRVYRATNANNTPVTATLYYQTYTDYANSTGNWTSFGTKTISGLAAGGHESFDLTSLADPAIFVKVEYSGTDVGFEVDRASGKELGIELDVTFNQRESNDQLREPQYLYNNARLDLDYKVFDNKGQEEIKSYSNEASVTTDEGRLPGTSDQVATIMLYNNIDDVNTSYPSGASVPLKVTAQNISVNGATYDNPVIAFDLPPYTELDGGISAPVISSSRSDVYTPTVFTEQVQATRYEGDTLVPLLDENNNPVMTTRVIYIFDGVSMGENDWISISYNAYIKRGITQEASSQINSLAYAASNSYYPKSFDNSYGLTVVYDSSSHTALETGLDGTLKNFNNLAGINQGYTNNKYAARQVEITVADTEGLEIEKSVRSVNSGTWVSSRDNGAVASIGTDIEYRVTVSNYMLEDLKQMRVIDLLPFENDTYILREGGAISRGTSLTNRPLLKSAPTVSRSDATLYYYVGSESDWYAGNRTGAKEAELPMLYDNTAGWSGGTLGSWVAAGSYGGSLDNVIAIGVDVDCAGDPMGYGDSMTIQFEMSIPDYGAADVDDFYNRILANSAVAAVTTESNNTSAPTSSIENSRHQTRMTTPLGSIGDYAFIDHNGNGIQDAGDEDFANVKVILYKVTQQKVGTGIATIMEQTETTFTDGNGLYTFEDLEGNLLKSGAPAGSTDPEDYEGDLYITYSLQFEPQTPGYAATWQHQGNEPALDSDINEEMVVEGVALSIEDVGGVLRAQDDDTIDAGFMVPAKIGDRVWFDENYTGIQTFSGGVAEQAGVPNVNVNLYVVDKGAVGVSPVARTTTDFDGYYEFSDIAPGEYVVEFDISNHPLFPGSSVYKYRFTEPGNGEPTDSADDSDAFEVMNEEDTIRRTKKFTIGQSEIQLDIDAGLCTYGVLGGKIFDDSNYNDKLDEDDPDLDFALAGTKVTLQKNNNGNWANQKTITIGEGDRSFLFDYLREGDYRLYYELPADYEAVMALEGDYAVSSKMEKNLSSDLRTGYSDVISVSNTASDAQLQSYLQQHAGGRKYGSIGDFVWLDENADGIQGPGEPGVGNVLVSLQKSKDLGNTWEYYRSTYTDSDGYYSFDRVPSGIVDNTWYRVVFGVVAGKEYTITNAGNDGSKDSNALAMFINGLGYPTQGFMLEYGYHDDTWDAGVVDASGTIGDRIWFDANKNGIQDPDEPGVAGASIKLEYNDSATEAFTGVSFLNGTHSPVAGIAPMAAPAAASSNLSTSDYLMDEVSWMSMASTTSNDSGYFRFDNLPEGYYRLQMQMPAGYIPTLLEASGVDSGSDSKASMELRDGNWVVTRPFYLDRNGYDMTWDMGICEPADYNLLYDYYYNYYGYYGYYNNNNVNTGDKNRIWLLVLALGMTGIIGGGAIILKKRKTKKQ